MGILRLQFSRSAFYKSLGHVAGLFMFEGAGSRVWGLRFGPFRVTVLSKTCVVHPELVPRGGGRLKDVAIKGRVLLKTHPCIRIEPLNPTTQALDPVGVCKDTSWQPLG